MNIGIIVHSQTGNTLSVAEIVSQKLQNRGHSVTIESIVPSDEREIDPTKIQLDRIPDLIPYEGVILACPVRGFNVSGAMLAYLNAIPSLENKKTALFVTHLFPFAWMGGIPTINRMKSICQEKKGNIVGTGIINWKGSNRERNIEQMAIKLSDSF